LLECNTKLGQKWGKGIAIATPVVSIVAAVIIFAIFPPNPINILLGIT
jgi:hypothetical protein